MTRSHSTLIRALTVGVLMLSVAGAANSAHAASTTKTYTSSALHYTFNYPSNWTVSAKLKTADVMGALEAKINPAVLQVMAPDQKGLFFVLVKTAGTTLAVIKANETGFLKEGSNLVGPIKYQNLSYSDGMKLVVATATDKGDGTHQVQALISAGSKGNFTWYTGFASVQKYPNSSNDTAALNKISASFRNT